MAKDTTSGVENLIRETAARRKREPSMDGKLTLPPAANLFYIMLFCVVGYFIYSNMGSISTLSEYYLEAEYDEAPIDSTLEAEYYVLSTDTVIKKEPKVRTLVYIKGSNAGVYASELIGGHGISAVHNGPDAHNSTVGGCILSGSNGTTGTSDRDGGVGTPAVVNDPNGTGSILVNNSHVDGGGGGTGGSNGGNGGDGAPAISNGRNGSVTVNTSIVKGGPGGDGTNGGNGAPAILNDGTAWTNNSTLTGGAGGTSRKWCPLFPPLC